MIKMSSETQSAESVVLLRKENGVAWITLNRPSVLNACDITTLKRLQGVLREIERDSNSRCVVLTGSGRAFCAGADLQALLSRSSEERELSLMEDLREGFNPIVSSMRNMDKPIIAMINGVAAGAGMGLAFACDLRIMSESARFVEAFAKVGLIPDSGATFFMPRLLGITKAMELAFTGEGIDAVEASKMGIVNRVVAADRLEPETREMAEKLARGPKGIGLAKRAINRALFMDLEGALNYEAQIQEIAGKTKDHKEGVRAFTEKRAALFHGE